MKQEIAKIWVEALRSGEYTQCGSVLKRSDAEGKYSHCCLGVLCELYNKNNTNEQKLTETEDYRGGITFNGEAELLPSEVLQWAGLRFRKGFFGLDDKRRSLADMNDTGSSFHAIADVIEQNVEVL